MTHPEHTPASPEPPLEPPGEPVALAPDTATLDPRAARAWTERMAVTALDDGRYAVRGAHGRSYVVDLRDRHEHRCSCPDNSYRGERCKHMRRVALEITDGRVPAPGRAAVTCRGCGARTFVRANALELCDDCRLPPGTAVRDRVGGTLLVVVAPTDTPACEVPTGGPRGRPYEETTEDSTEGSTVRTSERASDATTVADVDSNADYPRDDPVVWCVYPFSGHADQALGDLARYAFPRTRLTRRGVTDAQRAVVEHSGPRDGHHDGSGRHDGHDTATTRGPNADARGPGGDPDRGAVQTTL